MTNPTRNLTHELSHDETLTSTTCEENISNIESIYISSHFDRNVQYESVIITLTIFEIMLEFI